jgi:NRAMP (natural resistance-associated macrophage protein)-like metal ion transporter
MTDPQGAAPDQEPPRNLLARLGPGLITGAADDDPSGIGTYSQVGAQFGYQLAWTMLFSYPLLVSIQAICARIGAVTGKGIAGNLRDHYPRTVLQVAVLLLVVANVINLGADIGAMAETVGLLLPGPLLLYTFLFGLLSVVLEVWLTYDRYSSVLKWTTASLLAYVGVVFVSKVPLGQALRGIVLPGFTLDKAHTMGLVAVLGTTISPYLFFWEASEEVEELHKHKAPPLRDAPAKAAADLDRIGADNLAGMAYSQAIAIFIIIATAATLHAHGITQITSAAQAAQALRPIAGEFTFALFATGIIGIGLLAVPVLAGSCAYAVSETFGWNEGLNRPARDARAFYAVIALATLGGFMLNLLRIDPMIALYWAAVVNGLLAAPLLVLIMLLARNPKVMGELTIPRWLTLGGWVGTVVMAVVGVLFLVT